jgi:mitochondrial fission 1 protein
VSFSPLIESELGLIKTEIYSASPSHRRECTYYIAVGYYKLRNYSHARKFNGEYLSLPPFSSCSWLARSMGANEKDLLLSVEPDNMQAQSLRTLIEQSVTRDGYIGEFRLTGRVKPWWMLMRKVWVFWLERLL